MWTAPQFFDSVPIFESILTPVFSPNLNHIPEPVLIHVPINLKLELLIMQNYILLIENEYEPEHQFDLDPILKPNSTPKPLLEFNQTPESVLVPACLTLEPKSTTSPNHIQLLDNGVQKFDSKMIY